ncbi:MAG: LysE family transporter [Desulfotignum sp.]|nr:LysE family transporter [Desulfotignum sp.]
MALAPLISDLPIVLVSVGILSSMAGFEAVLVNVLSPHPYLFWMTVGAPLVHRALAVNMAAAGAFIAGFYVLLVGSKVVLALVVARSKAVIKGRAYVVIMRGLGAVLCLLALILVKDGLTLLGVW